MEFGYLCRKQKKEKEKEKKRKRRLERDDSQQIVTGTVYVQVFLTLFSSPHTLLHFVCTHIKLLLAPN